MPRRRWGTAHARTVTDSLMARSIDVTIGGAGPATRDAKLWPFSTASIWNTSIGSGATFADPFIRQTRNGYGTDSNPIVMSPSSPSRQIFNHAWPARCYQVGDTATGVFCPIPDDYIVAPSDGNWEGNEPNLPGAILLADGVTVQELQYISRCTNAGPISIADNAIRSTHSIIGNGRPDSFFGAHGGSGLTGLGGTIRLGELTNNVPIRHATRLTMDMAAFGEPAAPTTNMFKWPAYAADEGGAGGSNPYGCLSTGFTKILGMGSLLAIPSSVNINNLSLETAPALKLAWAWQNYGAYVVDNSGFCTPNFGQNLLNVEHGVTVQVLNATGIVLNTYADIGGYENTAWNRDMNRLFLQMREVTNNTASTIGGGGTRLQPDAPPFA